MQEYQSKESGKANNQLNYSPSINNEHEKDKAETALSIARNLIDKYNAEDRCDIINDVRRELERELCREYEAIEFEVKAKMDYVQFLKELVY